MPQTGSPLRRQCRCSTSFPIFRPGGRHLAEAEIARFATIQRNQNRPAKTGKRHACQNPWRGQTCPMPQNVRRVRNASGLVSGHGDRRLTCGESRLHGALHSRPGKQKGPPRRRPLVNLISSFAASAGTDRAARQKHRPRHTGCPLRSRASDRCAPGGSAANAPISPRETPPGTQGR